MYSVLPWGRRAAGPDAAIWMLAYASVFEFSHPDLNGQIALINS
jgi:hypothetical protein